MIKIKIILFVLAAFFLTSCANSWDSVKRGLTGQKAKSGDEFLVKKKDPLILPPDFDKLPTPDERAIAFEEMSSFEKTLGTVAAEESISSSSSSSNEESIINQIRKK